MLTRPPAAVFLMEARCGPDAPAEAGGRAGWRAAFQAPLPPRPRAEGPSTGTGPGAGRGWQPPTLFPGLLGPETPFRGAPRLTELAALGRRPRHLHLSAVTASPSLRGMEGRKALSWGTGWGCCLAGAGMEVPGEERVTGES